MTEEEESFSREDVDKMLEDHGEKIRQEVSGEFEEKMGEYESKINDIQSKIEPTEDEKLVDENWSPQSYNDLLKKTVEVVEQKFPQMAEQQKDDIVNAVMERQKEQQKTEQQELEKANKVIDQEIESVKKEDPDVNESEVFKFIGNWNKNHKSSPIVSFKDGYDLYSMTQNKGEDKKEEEKPRIPGAPSGEEEESQEPQIYQSPQDAMNAELRERGML